MRTKEDGEGERQKKRKDLKVSFNQEHVRSAFTK